MLSEKRREALAKTLGRGLRADSNVDAVMAWMRAENHGRIAYDDDLEDDPTTPKPELSELWSELWANYGEDTDEATPKLIAGRLVR